MFLIGKDLTDDHPVGVSLPDTTKYDFNAPNGVGLGISFYDRNGNGRADNNELRFYDSGEGFEVECASCHNPHGTPVVGTSGGAFTESFLRVNDQTELCMTCHNK